MTTPTDRIWAATLALLAIHQTEEVVFPIKAWADKVGGTGCAPIDRHIERTPLCQPELGPRLATVAGQAAGAAVLYVTTRRSLRATRLVTSALVVGWSAAEIVHIALSVRTRSAMPGLATSILPGLPGSCAVLGYIWR